MTPTYPPNSGMRLGERFRYVLSDIKHRLLMSLLCTAVVAVAVVYFLVLAFYARTMYSYQVSLRSELPQNHIGIASPDPTDAGRRLTEVRLEEIRQLSGIRAAFPRLELGVKLSLDQRSKANVTAESTLPGDPGLPESLLAWGRTVSTAAAHEAVLSQALFRKLCGELTRSGPRPESVFLEVSRTADGQTQVHTMSLRVVGLVRHQNTNRIYVPLTVAGYLDQWCAHQIGTMPGAGGRPELPQAAVPIIAAWGAPIHADRAVKDEAEQFGVTIRPESAVVVVQAPGDVWISVGRPDSMLTAAQLKALLPAELHSAAYPVRVLRFKTGPRDVRLVALTADDPRWRFAPGGKAPAFGEVLAGSGEAERALAVSPQVQARVVGSAEHLPAGGDFCCTPETFAWLAFESAASSGRPADLGTPELALCVTGVRFRAVRDAVTAAGLTFQPLTPVAEEKLVRYRVEADAGTTLTADLASALEMARPTFTTAYPVWTVGATLDGQEITLTGSSAADPQRFAEPVRHGRWLSPQAGVDEVVLPAALALRLFPKEPADHCLGREVSVRFTRASRVSATEPALTRRLRIVGLVEGATGFVARELAQGVLLWEQDKVIWDDAAKAFRTKAELWERTGYLRGSVWVRDAEEVPAVVAQLEALGWKTEHHLAERAALDKLARVLVFLVVLFVAGFAVSAVATVLITNAMHIESKTYEIGILRVHGVSTRAILSIFGIQGVLLGLAAFVTSCALALLAEPLFSRLIRDTFQVPSGALTASLWSPANWPLFLGAFALSVSAALLGAVLPALKACRLSPVQALQRRE